MRHSKLLKAIAIILAAVSLTAVIGSALGMWALASEGLYDKTYAERYNEKVQSLCETFANRVVKQFAALNFGGCPEELLNAHYGNYHLYGLFQTGKFTYAVADDSGIIWECEEGVNTEGTKHVPILVQDVSYLALVPEDYFDYANTFDVWYEREMELNGQIIVAAVSARCYYRTVPELTVHIYLEPDAIYEDSRWVFLGALYFWQDYLLYILIGGGLVFILCVVYLCLAVGRKKGTNEIRAGGLNRVPLDLYLLAIAFAVAYITPYGAFYLRKATLYYPLWIIPLVLTIILGCSFLFVAFCFACVAQIKSPDGFFYKNTLTYCCLCRFRQGSRWLIRAARALFKMIPTIWQWLLTAGVLGLTLGLTAWKAIQYSYFRIDDFFFFLFVLTVFACIGIVCYAGGCFGILIKGANSMAKGDLNRKIPTKYLFGSFKVFAENLNSLADAAYIAAQNQMRSERMKTELITNVSHDIKTPLTSIINFVDLLQKPHSDEERAQYLEVLSRQSAQMKRLIDDLMDLSKATTGNMTVSLAPLDAVEAVNQALGEFADKLDAANLTPVFRHPEGPVTVSADGRLLWRVLSNLLGNIVKYAMPGTRVYLDLTETDSCAVLSLKNISQEELNLTAEALMERFVQGDASRNTEGSGLGLNIAQSLMQVQRGSLSLHLDGDLFKVTLTLPKA